ncbi:MAG: hypothetical protein K9I74_07570, partial [Bacteroidales bacterium]|nr:hypothetical protein [Bacteroidales bacterium]
AIYFHPGLGKTGTTYLQYKFFPKLKGIHYIQRTKYNQASRIINTTNHNKYLVSREFDRQFFEETKKFADAFPDAHPILVLRRHDKWIASQYRRLTKNGRGITFKEFIDIKNNKGRWDKNVLNFYDRIKFLESQFNHKPLVLFHEELKNHPKQFFNKITTFTGTDYDINAISLTTKHVSYNENQLKTVRNIARKTFYKWNGIHIKKDNAFERRFRKAFCHLIMYLHFLFPKDSSKEDPLINPEELEEIKTHYARDWEQCLDYARKNSPNQIIEEKEDDKKS